MQLKPDTYERSSKIEETREGQGDSKADYLGTRKEGKEFTNISSPKYQIKSDRLSYQLMLM